MTVQFYIHSIAKRAKAIALLDSGATENFINLSYTKWLKLPIKQLDKPRKLFNIVAKINAAKRKKGLLKLQKEWDKYLAQKDKEEVIADNHGLARLATPVASGSGLSGPLLYFPPTPLLPPPSKKARSKRCA